MAVRLEDSEFRLTCSIMFHHFPTRLTIFSYHFEGLRKQDFVLLLKLLRAIVSAGARNNVKQKGKVEQDKNTLFGT